MRYIRQFTVFFGLILFILTLISFFKLFDSKIRLEIYRRIGNAIFAAAGKIKKFTSKLLSALGITEIKKLNAEDEKRIIIYDNKRKERKKRRLKRKFPYDENDAQKIRYMYTVLIEKKLKNGINVHHSETPNKLSQTLAQNETEKELFSLYQPARYKGMVTLTKEQLKEQYEYMNLKK